MRMLAENEEMATLRESISGLFAGRFLLGM
jgi:hypothetical protein